MTYAVFPTTHLGYLLAAKLHEEGADVVLAETAPSGRFEGVLTKYAVPKLRQALAKVKDKSAYMLIFDVPEADVPDGFSAFVPSVPATDGLCQLYRGERHLGGFCLIENASLGAGNTGPEARLAQLLVCRIKMPSVVRQSGDQMRKGATSTTVLGADIAGLYAAAGLAGGLRPVFEADEPLKASYSAVLGLYDAPEYLAEPRDVAFGSGEALTEAVDDAYRHVDPSVLHRPKFDFLSLAYDGSIIDRYERMCDDHGLPEFDEEEERTALLARDQEKLRMEREALAAERKRLQENYDTALARVTLEKEQEIAKIKAEVSNILHEADPQSAE